MEHESLLPPAQSLNHLINAHFDGLLKRLDEYYEANKSFVDDRFDKRQPALRRYTSRLTEILLERDATEAELLAGHEACHFALVAANMLQNDHVSLSNRDYLEGMAPEDRKVFITFGIKLYAHDRVMVEVLTNSYLDRIDPSGRIPQIVHDIALLTFMHIEQANCNRAYDDLQISTMEQEFGEV